MPLTPSQQQAIKAQTGNMTTLEAAIQKDYGSFNLEELKTKTFAPATLDATFAAIAEYEKKLTAYRENLLKGAPADGEEVKALLARMDKQVGFLTQLKAVLDEIKGKVAGFTDMAKYPNYEKDCKQLQELEKGYKIGSSVGSLALDELRDLAGQFKVNAELVNSVPKTYAPLINLKTPEGLVLAKYHEAAAKNLIDYMGKEKAFVEGTKAQFEKIAEEVKTTMQRAVDQKAPQLFATASRQLTGEGQGLLDKVAVIQSKEAPAVLKELQGVMEAIQKELATQQASQKEAIVAATVKPEDVYKGADRAELETMVREAWAKKYPSDQILGVHFSMPEWRRTDKKTFNVTDLSWTLSSRSELVARVVVKNSDTLAGIYAADFYKDHMQNDRVTVNVDTKGGVYVVEEMLLANYK